MMHAMYIVSVACHVVHGSLPLESIHAIISLQPLAMGLKLSHAAGKIHGAYLSPPVVQLWAGHVHSNATK